MLIQAAHCWGKKNWKSQRNIILSNNLPGLVMVTTVISKGHPVMLTKKGAFPKIV